jgi:hypothetical protein
MGNVKELQRKKINKAAASYLCDQPSGDLYDAYNELCSVSEEGNGDRIANLYVVVWQPLENMSVDEMIELIEAGVDDEPEVPAFIQNMNWELLKQQKQGLLAAILHAQTAGNDEWTDQLTGILHTIDALQDYVVDVLGMDENLVFTLTPEE